MATLTINDGAALEVVGAESWAPGGIQGGVAHIGAMVRVPGHILMADLDKTDARVVLTVGKTVVRGESLCRVGGMRTNGDTVYLRFEGESVARLS